MGELAIAMTGGGARAAYQVGCLKRLAEHDPSLAPTIYTGVSAGAINAAFLAQESGTLAAKLEDLTRLWLEISPEEVFSVRRGAIAGAIARWLFGLLTGGRRPGTEIEGLLNTTPLRAFLAEYLKADASGRIAGVARNLASGELSSVALTTVDYATGRSVTWVEGRDVERWERPHREAIHDEISVDHVLASAALPILFPAVRLGGSFHGDGGIRLTTPLSASIHLGADRVIAISNKHIPERDVDRRVIEAYPPPAQVLGVLLNSLFLDAVEQDALRLERVNDLLEHVPGGRLGELRKVKLLVLTPSIDLGQLAAQYEARMPLAARTLTRGLGSRDTRSPDLMSLLLFQHDYVKRLIDLGTKDVEDQLDRVDELLS